MRGNFNTTTNAPSHLLWLETFQRWIPAVKMANAWRFPDGLTAATYLMNDHDDRQAE